MVVTSVQGCLKAMHACADISEAGAAGQAVHDLVSPMLA